MNNTVLRMDKIIHLLTESKDGLGVTEISRSLGLAKSTVYDIITTMLQIGYVEYADARSSTYRVGLRLYQYGSHYIRTNNFYLLADSVLNNLRNKLGQTVFLGIESNRRIVFVQKYPGSCPISLAAEVGDSNYMHLTAMGKALLASYSKGRVHDIVGEEPFFAKTDATLTTYEELDAELEAIRIRGYSFDNGESVSALRCIGAPVFDSSNEAIGAVGMSVFGADMTEENREYYAREVIDSAMEISHRMGYLWQKNYQR